ncbi:DEXQc_SHPRH and SF2_C_SNF domain-containing protein [Emydomyces testavorans]|uniref:DEXQc_SHPRH and SF2_C_SNF domain-containing protein n=1 Tax=Emydomyces testavorans TaxID=2070801 RepID=A0AAF0DMX3_9EURO|nr:DEXQc_SHPRH and SF2_C_SNF domain-containing protein [Emydomyces testavorans]
MSSFDHESTIPAPIPREFVILFARGTHEGIEEPPAKRRKTQWSKPLLDTQAAEELLPQYLTMFRLNVKLTFNEPPIPDHGREYDTSVSIPILLRLRHRTALYPRLKIQTDYGDILLNELDLQDYLYHLKSIVDFPSIYRTSGIPLACYKSLLRKDPEDELSFLLEVKALWKDSPKPHVLFQNISRGAKDAFLHYFGGSQPSAMNGQVRDRRTSRWAPSEFYDNVHVPKKQVDLSSVTGFESIKCQLFPFQERAVGWLLEREGVEVLPDGSLSDLVEDQRVPLSFIQTTDAEGRPCFLSHLLYVAMSDLSGWPFLEEARGGILAEEMGLGKTVELLTLICLHRRSQLDLTTPYPDLNLTKSGATLIVTPPAILEQWKQEIAKHAPRLRYVQYRGIQHSQEPEATIVEQLASHDIVLTTYSVLQREIHFAEDPPDRSLRHQRTVPRRRSPLVRISWWRICIDEAQMVETGVSNAARVARIIPRCNAWAVTGTPLRKDMKDLFGLLFFLRYEPFCYSMKIWGRICEDFKPVFRSLIKKLVMRHNKDMVRNELHLPHQKRIVITIPFTPVEEQHYEQLFQQMCQECGLDSSGAPVAYWDPTSPKTVERMRYWLTRLRQACLHPEIAVNARRVFGSGPLRSVAEVLEVMIDQNETQIRSEERGLLLSQIRRGQLLENAENPQGALQLWKDALSFSQEIVADCRSQLAEALKDTQVEDHDNLSVSDTESEETGEAEKSRIGTYHQRLRGALEIEHMCKFFIASAFYQIKADQKLTEPDSKEFQRLERLEEESYEAAKFIRRELLAETSRRVNKHIDVVRIKAENEELVQIPYMTADLRPGGIESHRILDQLEDFSEVMNRRTAKFNKWRDHMVKLILRPLVDEEDGVNLQGDEYESSTKVQDDMYVYMEALRALVADHHDAITGQKSALVRHELQQALEKAKGGEGPSPKLFVSLMDTCKKLKAPKELGSLRGILNELRNLVSSLEWQESGGSARARTELAIIEDIHKTVSKMFSTHSKVAAKLEREVILFQRVANRRLEYYRHLQQISDTVAPYDEASKGKPLDREQFDSRLEAEERMKTKLSGLKSKRRYLIHLRDEASGEETTRICIICQCAFETGVLTVCGHKYCKDCLRLWWRQHRSCPVCKNRLRSNELHQITYKPTELVAQEEKTPATSESDHSMKNAIYSDIKSSDMKEIKDTEINGSFGTKIDTLARHLIWLRHHDPGAKSIVFSQYKSFLGILASAFSRFNIEFSSVDSRNGIELFKKEPSIECFLLHAKAHSSGLNLVNATHVFLCEPLINTAIELQAIARVHRIGQHRETTVWMYLVSDSVEESIYQISVSRRLAHIAQKQKGVNENGRILSSVMDANSDLDLSDLAENVIDAANSLEMQDVALGKLLGGRSAEGEIVDDNDLWQCLFGKVKKNDSASGDTTEPIRLEVDRMLRADAAEERRDAINH